MPSAVGAELLATSPASGVIHRTGTISGVMNRRSRASMFGAVLRHCAMSACAWFAIMVAVTAVASCGVLGGHGKYVRLQELPPTRATVIHAALRSYDIPLTVHSSCTGVGDDDDPTVGRYLARLISFLEDGQDNSVEVRIVPREAPSGRYWRASMMFRALVSNGDGFYYGVEFLIRQSDGAVIPSSFSCPGLP